MCGVKKKKSSKFLKTKVFQMTFHLSVLLPPSPLFNGINVPEEQQELAGGVLLPVREEQVVSGDAQGASDRRLERLSEHNILHIGILDVLGKLHLLLESIKKKKHPLWLKCPLKSPL